MLDHTGLLAVSFRGRGDMFNGSVFSVDLLKLQSAACLDRAQMFRDLADATERSRSTPPKVAE
jgi:hypothetical protein